MVIGWERVPAWTEIMCLYSTKRKRLRSLLVKCLLVGRLRGSKSQHPAAICENATLAIVSSAPGSAICYFTNVPKLRGFLRRFSSRHYLISAAVKSKPV